LCPKLRLQRERLWGAEWMQRLGQLPAASADLSVAEQLRSA
jgi:hypothetical protein